MRILKKLGGSVKKTVKKVVKPVQKVAKSKIADKLSENDAMMGVNKDILAGDFGNLPNRLTQAQNQAKIAAAYEAGGPLAAAQVYQQQHSQNGDTAEQQPIYNQLVENPQSFSSAPWELAKQKLGINNPQNLLQQVFRQRNYSQPELTAQDAYQNDPNSFDNVTKQMQDMFGSQIKGQKDYTNAENVGSEVASSDPWYKKLGGFLGGAASKVGGAIGDAGKFMVSDAGKPYLGGLAQIGGGIASNLYSDKAMRDYISAVNQGQDLDYRLQGPSAMEGLTGTEEFGRMQQFAKGGMTPEEEAARQNSLRMQNQNIMANNQAIAESAQRRGLRGGQQIAQQMLGAQEGANRLSQDEQNLRAQMFGRSERATGNLLSTRAGIAAAQDAQRAADANRMTEQALYRQNAKQNAAQLGASRKAGQGQIFASTGDTFANILNPPKQNQQNNALGQFNQQYQETEEQKRRRMGQG